MTLGSQPQEITREQLFSVLGVHEEDFILVKIAAADKMLRGYEIEIQPRLQDDPPDGVYLLKQKNAGVSSSTTVRTQLAEPESASQEFKSTYWCDLDRRSHQPGATAAELRSDAIKHAALKAIGGFLTTGGGTLFIGVSDAGEVLGLQSDLEILPKDRQNADKLINNIKTDIAAKFRDGTSVNDYVSIEAVEIDNAQILQLKVTSRSTLSFLRLSNSEYQLFRRQDNRTIAVKIYELGEFQTWRSKHIPSVDL